MPGIDEAVPISGIIGSSYWLIGGSPCGDHVTEVVSLANRQKLSYVLMAGTTVPNMVRASVE